MERDSRSVGFTQKLSGWAEALLPQTAGAAFARGLLLSLLVGLTLVVLFRWVVHLGAEFGGWTYDGYWELATNLIRGNGYVVEPGGPPIHHRPPVVPLLFAPLTLLSPLLQRVGLTVLQSLMVGAICGLLFDLAERIRGPRAAGLAVGVFLAFPPLYFHVRSPISILTQTLLVLAVLNLLGRELQQVWQPAVCLRPVPWPRRVVLLGVSLALALLTHGSLALSLLLIWIGVMACGLAWGQRRLLLVPALAGVLTLVLIAPWTLRNWYVTHRLVPVATNAGFAYFYGSAHWLPGEGELTKHTRLRALQMAGQEESAQRFLSFSGITDPDLSARLDRQMVAHIREQPGRFVGKVVLNAVEFYFPAVHDVLRPRAWHERSAMLQSVERVALSLWNGLLLGLAVVGLWRSRHGSSWLALWGLWGAVLALALPYLPFLVCVTHNLYAFPTMPLLVILAVQAFVTPASSGRR